MNNPHAINIQTQHLTLVLETPESLRSRIEAYTPEERAELSADWLAQVEAATSPDPWVHGFTCNRSSDGVAVGCCGFKGAPTPDGDVEIAYGIEPDHQGRGYATDATLALTNYALNLPSVRVVRAHTLPETNASTRVLTKCGFKRVGEVIDPDDGLVWRWERRGEWA